MTKTCEDCGTLYQDGICPECEGWEQCDCGKWAEELTPTEDGDVCPDCLQEYTQCADCSEYVIETRSIANGDQVCESCFDDNYVYCDRCSRVIEQDESNLAPNGEPYCSQCFDNHCDCCASCGETCWNCDTQEAPNRDYYCPDCWCDSCTCCDACGQVIWSDDACSSDDGGTYCEDCVPNDDYEFDAVRFQGRESYTRIGKRRFGVEIETAECSDYAELDGRVPFDAKFDGSISGKEFASTILYGDAGLEAVENLCAFAKRHYWQVDNRCGLHVHLDASNEKTKSLKAIALAFYASYGFWLNLVDPRRDGNTYCGWNHTCFEELHSIKNFSQFARYQNRYEWINFAAYIKHKTFEVRLHQGSLNAEVICNWIRLCSIFMDWAASMSFTKVKNRLLGKTKIELHDYIMQICKDAGHSDLVDYYNAKAGRIPELCASVA